MWRAQEGGGTEPTIAELHAGADVVDMLLAAAPVGFAFYDTGCRYIRINEVLAAADEIPVAGHLGRRPTEILGDFGALIEERVQRVLDTGQPVTVEDLTTSHDGVERLWNTSWYPTRNATGELLGVAVVALEVSDRWRAEQRMRRSEERYRSLVQATALDVWQADAMGRLTSDMPAWRSITGQEPEGLVGTGWLSGVHHDDRERVRATWLEAVRHMTPYVCEYRVGTDQREWRVVVARGIPIIEEGRLVEWVGTTLDVTEARAIETARAESYSRVRDAALTLQRSILPEQPLQPEEVRVCARYVPGVADTEVGGDWYDVIELGAGRLGFVVGDVMGRGIRAAAVMGQLRTAVRAYSRLDLPPGELLSLLDGLVAEFQDGQIVTCAYAVYDPGTQQLTVANAGHLPLILLDERDELALLDREIGAPLGVGLGVYAEESVRLGPGALLAMYTDGLVESRDRDIDEGIDLLVDALREPVADLEGHADRVLDRLGRVAGHEDDVALLLVRVPTDATHVTTATVPVPRGIRSVAEARSACDAIFRQWQLRCDVAESALLVVNELVTNALVHGRQPIEVVLRLSPTRLYVEVTDGSGHLPRRRLATLEDEGGRGLHLVAMLSERWGVRPEGDGKAVWAAIPLHPEP